MAARSWMMVVWKVCSCYSQHVSALYDACMLYFIWYLTVFALFLTVFGLYRYIFVCFLRSVAEDVSLVYR